MRLRKLWNRRLMCEEEGERLRQTGQLTFFYGSTTIYIYESTHM